MRFLQRDASMRAIWSDKQNCSHNVSQKVKWAIPPVRLGLSGRNSGKIPERPRKGSQSVSWNSPREYGWDAPSPIIQGISGFRAFPEFSPPPVRLGTPLFFRSGSGEGLSELVMEFPAVLGAFLIKRIRHLSD